MLARELGHRPVFEPGEALALGEEVARDVEERFKGSTKRSVGCQRVPPIGDELVEGPTRNRSKIVEGLRDNPEAVAHDLEVDRTGVMRWRLQKSRVRPGVEKAADRRRAA